MDLTVLAERAAAVLDEVERAVVGKRDRLELVLAGILADGHVLLEDVPGLAKTLTARSFAEVTGLRFARVQFTPDLLPSDVTGSSIWNQRDAEFAFRAGPIFTNILLADEINRAPPKTQARCSRRCRSGRSRRTARPVCSSRRSSSSPRRTRSSTRARTRFPRRSSTASCSARGSGIRQPKPSGRCSRGGSSAGVRRCPLQSVVDRETLLAMQRAVEGCTWTRAWAATSSTS
jgi:hypothetical protein